MYSILLAGDSSIGNLFEGLISFVDYFPFVESYHVDGICSMNTKSRSFSVEFTISSLMMVKQI